MNDKDNISDDLSRRIDAIAARSSLTRAQIIEDALAHGRSLAWHEKWVTGVQEGLAEAERGEFATEEEIAAILTKYGPV
jgi:predicted transcriptional regulator